MRPESLKREGVELGRVGRDADGQGFVFGDDFDFTDVSHGLGPQGETRSGD